GVRIRRVDSERGDAEEGQGRAEGIEGGVRGDVSESGARGRVPWSPGEPIVVGDQRPPGDRHGDHESEPEEERTRPAERTWQGGQSKARIEWMDEKGNRDRDRRSVEDPDRESFE